MTTKIKTPTVYELIVTNGDRTLCPNCFDCQFNDQDEATELFFCTTVGTCEDCGATVTTAETVQF